MRVFYSMLVGETSLDNARLYREVAQARDQLDIILQRVADGIIVYDSHSKIIYTNEAAAQISGYTSVQAMLQTPPFDKEILIWPTDQQR
jgi:PAS domain S-box-containing protein